MQDSQANYNPQFPDGTYVDIYNAVCQYWENGGIVYGSKVSLADGITHTYFVILYDGIVYTEKGSLRHNGEAKWVEEKYLRLAENPKID